MKGKLLFNLGLGIILTVIISSCLNSDDKKNEPTEAEELSQLKTYLDSLQMRGYNVDTTALGVYKTVVIYL